MGLWLLLNLMTHSHLTINTRDHGYIHVFTFFCLVSPCSLHLLVCFSLPISPFLHANPLSRWTLKGLVWGVFVSDTLWVFVSHRVFNPLSPVIGHKSFISFSFSHSMYLSISPFFYLSIFSNMMTSSPNCYQGVSLAESAIGNNNNNCIGERGRE